MEVRLFVKRNYCNINKGSITIYLTLVTAIILSFIFSVIESARITSVKTRTKAVTYSSLDSAFSHFALQLYEKYGIFGVFTAEEDFLSLVEDYIKKNCNPKNPSSINALNLIKFKIDSIEYNNIYHLTDNDGIIFASQATSYEKYRAANDFLKEISDLEHNVSDISSESPAKIDNNTIMITDKDINLMKNISADPDSGLYKNISQSDAANLKNNIVAKVTELLKSNLLLFFTDNPASLSHTEISDETKALLPSHTCILSENAKAIQSENIPDTITTVIDKGLFLSYINNSFSSYYDKVNPDISLKYQREYLLCGRLSDSDNLLAAAMAMVNLRASLNFAYLLRDYDKRSTAINLANSLCRSIPIASQAAAALILSVWSYAEGIIDVKDLFMGKKVPLIKNSQNWTLSVEGILSMNKNTKSSNPGHEGYSYDHYLNMCLLTADSFKLYFRSMDLIQLDICENCNSEFLFAACISGADINVNYHTDSIFINTLKLISPNTYKFQVNMVYGYD